jgi:hypothetical protein
MIASDSVIIDDARKHLSHAISQTDPLQAPYGSRWAPQVAAMRRDIPSLEDVDACMRYAQCNITFDGRAPFPGDHMIIQFREWAVENEFPHMIHVLRQMHENLRSVADSLGEFNGRKVSRVMYYHARTVLAGLTYASKPTRILEIGAGYGEIARLFLKNCLAPATSYIIVDIPESLFFAEVALRAEFGEDVGYLIDRDPRTRVLLVPIPLLAKLERPSELVVNTGSMQEMTDDWIDFYMRWLSTYDTRFFYCHNYAAQPISIMGESCNLWTQRLGPEWSTRHLRLNIPLLDMEGPTRDYLETLYEKVPATRNIREWSIYRGHIMSKTTYVEGLDLLRQDLTVENAAVFVNVVLEQMPYHPKELLYVVEWLLARGRREYEGIRTTLRSELGGMLEHHPDPPMGTARA